MKNDLEPAKKILRNFLAEIDEVRAIRKMISIPQFAQSFTIKDAMPVIDDSEFNHNNYWEKEDAYIWLYADAWDYHAFMHRPKPPPTPEYYSQLAWPLYQQWQREDKEVLHRKCEKIPLPSANISLLEYLQQLALTISEENEHRDVWIESLRSFLQFLRDDTELEEKGPLEILFPSQESCKGMEIRKNYLLKGKGKDIKKVEGRVILRRIENTVYPIDILAASEILMCLANNVLEGRSDSQHSAAQALGFAWLCHAVACSRLVTRETLVFSTKLCNFRTPELSNPKERGKPTYFIAVSSLFGIIDVPVSKTIYEYLLALPRDSQSTLIFNMDWETVLRTFRNKGVRQSKRAQQLGPITFLTFMHQPHHAIGHRTNLRLSHSKSKKKNCHPVSNLK